MAHSRIVAILCCTTLQVCLGTVYAWSFFQTLLVRQLGWSFTDTALAFSITIFSLGISAAGAGMMLPKVGPKRLALAGSLMFSGGYVIAGLALQLDSLVLFYLGYGVIGGTGIGLGYVTPVATVAKWFPDNKGLATGIVVMGFGVGAVVLSKGLAPLLLVQTEGDLPFLFIWLGVVFAAVLIPCSLALRDPPATLASRYQRVQDSGAQDEPDSTARCLYSGEFAVMWLVFFFNIAAGIAVISFQSPLLQDVWGLADPTVEPETLAAYGATLIAASSLCNGFGRLFWGLLSDRIGRIRVFRILLASQMIVFGILMTERNPWIFSISRLLHPALLRRRLRDDALFRARRLRCAKDVCGLWLHADGLGGGGRLWPPLHRLSQGSIPRPSHHLLLPDRCTYPGTWVCVLLPAERQTHRASKSERGRHASRTRYRDSAPRAQARVRVLA